MNARTGALVVERVLSATPNEVFDAWTTPSRMAAWMSPVGAAEAEVDLRVGGSFRVVMVEARLEHRGEYLEIDRPSRLAFTWVSPFTGAEPSVVTLELHPHDDGTRVVLTYERLPEDVVDGHRDGWGTMIKRLAGILAT
ncbi:MAG TPA: SRPBCC domain-containing protein [Actinomycetota bacterium]|nr:SRPBCC domain-containing protein [Actinomycetota bacterium]